METAKREATIRQNLKVFVVHALHFPLPLALPRSSDCATGLLNPPHSQSQSGEPPTPRMNLSPSNQLLLLAGLLHFCKEPRRSGIVPVDLLFFTFVIFVFCSQVQSTEDKHVRTSPFLLLKVYFFCRKRSLFRYYMDILQNTVN